MTFSWRPYCLIRNSLLPVLLLGSTGTHAQQAASHCAFPEAHLGGPVNAHTRFIEKNLLPAIVEAGTKPFSLEDRMRVYGVPGVSVAVCSTRRWLGFPLHTAPVELYRSSQNSWL